MKKIPNADRLPARMLDAQAWCRFAASWQRGGVDPPRAPLRADDARTLLISPMLQRAWTQAGRAPVSWMVDDYRSTLALNLLRLAELERIAELLDREGIAWAPIKGASMLLDDYALDPGVRVASDVDLIVSPRDYAGAESALRARHRVSDVAARPSMRAHHARPMESIRDGVTHFVDLHASVGRIPQHTSLVEDALARGEPDRLGLKLRSSDRLLVLSIHRARNGFAGDPRDLIDARVLLDRLNASDRDALVDAATRYSALGALLGVLLQTADWAGVGDADAMIEDRVRSAMPRWAVRVIEERASGWAVWNPERFGWHPLARRVVIGSAASVRPGLVVRDALEHGLRRILDRVAGFE